MSDSPTVTAVVVTYNRLDKLKNVLSALEDQTLPPSELVVVDNASTDGTGDFLASYASEQHGGMSVKVISCAENLGGAGGFSAGMKSGYDSGSDFVWIFDDDGYPEPDALEKLIQGYNGAVDELGPDVPYACSVVKFIDGSICEMNNPVPTWDWGRLLAKGQNSVMVTSCSFVSVLIPRWVIESFGLPFKEYFIWFDDAEYTLRITKTCPGIQVLDSVIIHDMASNKGVNFSMIDEKNAWKFSYGIRNQASYRLHHEGKAAYLLFCAQVCRSMKAGGVDKKLQRQMRKKMREAIKFNPKIDYPQSM